MASFRGHQRAVAVYFIMVVLSLCTIGEAAEFAGGTGEPNNPYQIATAEQLTAIGSDPNLLNEHFILVADIDLDPDLPGGRVFDRAVIVPDAGAKGTAIFTGRFDGRGHTISGLRIVSARSDIGLFGAVGYAGVLQNLRLKDVSIVTNAPVACIGTLVGYNRGVVERCEAIGVLLGYEYIGGLVGLNLGTVRECSFIGSVSGVQVVGGLIGDNEGVVVDCCCNGPVVGRYTVGGLFGGHGGTLVRGYATGPATPLKAGAGGLMESSEGVIADSYLRDASSGGGPNNGYGTPLSDEQMRQRASFAGWDFLGETNDGGRDTWRMPDDGPPVLSWQTGQTALVWLPELVGASVDEASVILTQTGLLVGRVTYDWDSIVPLGQVIAAGPAKPVPSAATVDLLVSKGPYDWQTNPGEGSSPNPCQIDTAGQLDCMGHRPDLWDRCFVLTGDIDLAGRAYRDPVIASDENDDTSGFQGVAFTGSLDGRGHRVMGLTVVSSSDYTGLFGMIAQGASVRNLVLQGAYVVGNVGRPGRCGTGALAGESYGLISCCGSADGQVVGRSDVGGLLGHNCGTVEACYACGFVTGFRDTGGLVGTCDGVITESYARVRAVGGNVTGGLVGQSGGAGAVRCCYALGPVTSQLAPTQAGGLLGSSWAGDPVSSYFLAPESGGGPDNKLGTAVTDAQMRNRATFVDWDFETAWSICEGKDYPRLRWEQVECE